MGKQQLGMALRQGQRLALLGRLRMAEWIEMPEREFAKQVEEIEKDSLFKKLQFGSAELPGVIRRQCWPGGRMSSGFYEINDAVMAGGERVRVEEKLGEKAALMPKIQKMGQKAFEKYFLYAEESITLEEIAKRTGLSLDDVRAIHDMLLEIGAEAEFSLPNRAPELARSYSCLARLSLDAGTPSFEFFSPYWARGTYHVRYDLLEDWKKKDLLSPDERKRLRHLLKKIEILNLRQSTLFRILEAVTKLHADFFRTREEDRKRPISLRLLAHRLDLAPSTVSRALHGRSVRLPWGLEIPLIELTPGRRNVVRDIFARWLDEGKPLDTDSRLVGRLKNEYGISVSRRTINTVRNEALKARG